MHYSLTGSGIPLVFQHGLGASLEQVNSLLGGLEGIRLITADMRGHGKTMYDPRQKPSFDSYADDIVRLLSELNIEKAFFGGISMGSGISLNIARRYPSLVSGLVLVRPAWKYSPNPDNLLILNDVASALETPAGEEMFMQRADVRQMQEELPLALKSLLGMFHREQGEFTAQVLRAMVGDYPVNQGKLPNVPSIIIGNGRDPLHPWALAEFWHEQLPGSRLHRVESRYIENETHTAQVRELIHQFIIKKSKT